MPDHPESEGIQSRPTSEDIQSPLSGSKQSVEVEYSLSIDDLLALQDYHLAHTTGAARSSLWWAFPAFFILIGTLALSNIVMDWKRAGFREFFVLACSTVGIAGYCFWRPLLRAKLRRDLRHERSLFLPHRVMLTPEAIEHAIGPNSTRSLWVGIAKIDHTKTHLFIYTSPNQAIVVPGRAFQSEEDFEDFCKTAQQYFRITRWHA